MKSWKKIAVSLLVLLLLGLAIGWSVIRRGFSARETPTKMEAFVATRARALAVPSSYRSRSNPVPNTPETLRAGMEHFADHCAVCHDNNGDGQTIFGLGLYPRPPDLRKPDTQKLSDGELFWIIENGVRFTGMPAFSGHGAATEDSWKLVHFIRHLPRLAPEELAEMDRYNPKGPEDREEEQQEEDFLGGQSAGPSKGAPGEASPKPQH